MIGNIKKRVGSWKRAWRGQSRQAAAAVVLPDAEWTAPETTDETTPEPAEANPTDALEERARLILSRRVLTLMESCKGKEHDGDALALLNGLTADDSEIIRQPPTEAQQVLAVCRRPDSSIAELTSIIERHPGMTQSLLKHANSAWYSTPGAEPIVQIRAAVQKIGTTGVYGSVVATVIASELARPGPGFNEMARQVWDHMVRVGPLARSFAKAFAVDPEQAFTAGLLHDIGKLVVFDVLAEQRRRNRRAIVLPDGFIGAVLGDLHEPLGALASLRWGLPVQYAEAILTHHRSPVPEDPVPLGEVVHLTERVDLATVNGAAVDLEWMWGDGSLTGDLEEAVKIWDGDASEEDEPGSPGEAEGAEGVPAEAVEDAPEEDGTAA